MEKQKRNFITMRAGYIMKRSLVFLTCFVLASMVSLHAQTKSITGKVIDINGEPLIGVSVKITGTTTGTVTDFDGIYTISAKAGDALEFSYIGMHPQTITVTDKATINVTLEDNSTLLTETVVIGYGSAKIKDLTSPIAVVSGDDINRHVTTSPMQGLQGKVSGIQVINTGEPGGSPNVRIRGVGNFDGKYQGPLYVVDGMFFDNIDFLSNSDVENISILKDASSSAIYGVRAANGVVLVTTKKGVTNRKPQITYDGYFGVQKAMNVMKMANSTQYATMLKEYTNADLTPITNSIKMYGGDLDNLIPGTNTDWYDELSRIAPMHSHSLSVTGGSDKISYSLGVNYLNQEGIMDANTGYERINVRTRVDATLTNWWKVGGNVVVISSSQDKGDMGAWGHSYTAPTIFPVYDKNNVKPLNPDGYTSVHELGFGQYFWNPMAIANFYDETINTSKILPSFYTEFSLFDSKLTMRNSFSQSLTLGRTRIMRPNYEVSASQIRTDSDLQKKSAFSNDWVLDNVLTYRDSFEKHSITAMVGNSFRQENSEWLQGYSSGVSVDKQEHWYLYQGTPYYKIKDGGNTDTWPDDGASWRGTSFFGRVMYDYAGKYLVSATFRADGTNKYQEKWGYFPSLGLGWVVTEEEFMKEQKIVDFLKLRASWGRLGNDKIQPNRGFQSIEGVQGALNGISVDGIRGDSYYTSLKWEKVEELDFGFDLTILNNRLSIEFDYYNRITKDAVINRPLPLVGKSVLMNNGEIKNQGLELSLNWSDAVTKDFSYNIGINASTLKNKVTYLDGSKRIMSDGDYARVRMLGEVADAYYGYVVDGIYQNQAEIDNDKTIAYLADGKPKVGSFKYKDLDGDGHLTSKDREVLGSPLPKLFFGGNIGFSLKNWDFNTAFQSQFGHKLINLKRLNRQKQNNINFDADLVKNRWTGEGSTNTYPSAAGWQDGWNYKFNNFYTENANTFTIQNIQLGYTFKNVFKNSSNNSSLRVGFTAERPFSFYSYNGFTTDIADGIDLQPYPMASTYTIGVRLVY